MITHEANESEYCTVAEAAEMLRVSQPTVRRWIASHRLSVVRLSPRILRIRRQDLRDLAPGERSGRRWTWAELEPYTLPRQPRTMTHTQLRAHQHPNNAREHAPNEAKP